MSKAPKKTFFGKYRGTVFNNVDPEMKGRIQAIVPDALGVVPTTWATPCVPVTGNPGLQSGIYVVPPIDASVWMEFEHGDPDLPIWTGCFWGSPAEVPLPALMGAPAVPNIVLQTIGQNTILMSGDPATGIIISCGLPVPGMPGITISQAGVIISDGKGGTIALAEGIVTINFGALVVTQP
jgi:type VI secretion system (T6SS) baseplate-like injector VgrG